MKKQVWKIYYNKRTLIIKTKYSPSIKKDIIWYPKKWRGINIFSIDNINAWARKAFNDNSICWWDAIIGMDGIGTWK